MTPRHTKQQAFTLLELMIVVVIVGVLAAIAIPSFSQYVMRARAAEAPTLLADLRNKQEAYRSEFGEYCSTDGTNAFPIAGGWQPRDLGDLDGDKHQWPVDPGAAWRFLGFEPDGPVYFSYSSAAGPNTTAPVALGFEANDFWFVAQAQGDLDGDGNRVTFEAYSASTDIWVSEAGGWE